MNVTVLGSGKVGTAIARTALRTGHSVRIAGPGAAEKIELLVRIVAPGAIALNAVDALKDADIVILSIPVTKYTSLNTQLLTGHIVIDAMNYWPDTDGHHADFAINDVSSSEVIAHHLARSRVVKTLNHIGYHELESDGTPAGTSARRALAVVSDDNDAAQIVADFIDSLGFDAVTGTPLALGKALEPGTQIFSGRKTAEEITQALKTFAAHALTSSVPNTD